MLKSVYDPDTDNRVDYSETISDGTNTKTAAQVKTHIDSVANPHTVTAAQAGAVATTGDESVAGVKTFTSFPVTPSSAPTTDYQVANRKYVIDTVGSATGTVNAVKEAGVQVGDADIATLDFDGDDFNTTESPDKEVNITIRDAGINHDGLANFDVAEHFTQAAISITAAQISNLNAGTDPTADLEEESHATEHQSGGADAIKLDDLGTPDDNTDLNASILRHGLTPKLSNIATEYLNGLGAWSTPAGSGGGAIILDIGDDSGNDSTALGEIATSGDTNSIITEPSADKMLINMGANWPTADVANSGDSATSFFTTGIVEAVRLPTATPSNGDTTHVSTADQIYDWIISLGYSTFDGAYSSLSGIPSTFTPASHGDSAHSETYLKTESDPTVDSSAEIQAIIGAGVYESALGFTPENAANKAAASGYASLDANSKVVQDPANATATPTASKIPIADGSGKLDGWITTPLYASDFGTGAGKVLEGDTAPGDIGAEPADATIIKEGEAGIVIDNYVAPAVSGDTTVTEKQSMRGLWSDKNITGQTDVHLDDYASWLSMKILIDAGTYPVSVCPPSGEKLKIQVLGIMTWLDADDEADLSGVEGNAFALQRRYSASLVAWYWELLPIDGAITDGGVPD